MTQTGEDPRFTFSAEQENLLNITLVPFRLQGHFGDGTKWPVWDYVARAYSQSGENALFPEEILSELPVGVSARDDRSLTRLYWVEPIRRDGSVANENTFGLTIAGMHALRSKDPVVGKLADCLANVIGDLARADAQLDFSPFEVASWNSTLTNIKAIMDDNGQFLTLTLNAAAVAEVLKHESVVLDVSQLDDVFACKVSGRHLREFRNVYTAQEYLEIAWRPPLVSSELPSSSPLTLIETIDYFAYVLAAIPGWDKNMYPVQPRSLKAAASLGMDCTTREEFADRISSLCTVIDQFKIPEIPNETLKKDYNNSDGSLNRLTYVLRSQIAEEPHLSNMEEALQVLRKIRGIRITQQHDSADKRSKGINSRIELGLPALPESSTDDWNTVRGVAARAFSQLITALQSSPTD